MSTINTTSILNSFKNKYIILSLPWLEDCIEFYKQQQNASNLQKDIENFVYLQWLMLDLREVDVPILPEGCTTQIKCLIENTVCLQLMSIVDISKPKLWQLHRIRIDPQKPLSTDEFSEFNPNSKRCLQLTLTDGCQELKALEYRPISCLNVNLKPGLKIKFVAPFTIRRGQIMLVSEENLLLLGGEVEELLISNATENILASALNLPLNENPGNVECLEICEIEKNAKGFSVANRNNKNVNKNDNKNVNKNVKSTSNKISNTAQISISNKNPKSSSTKVENTLNLEQDLFDDDFDYMIELESNLKSTVAKSKTVIPIEDDIDEMLEIQEELKLTNIKKVVSKPEMIAKTTNKKLITRSNTEEELDILLEIENDLNVNSKKTVTKEKIVISNSSSKNTVRKTTENKIMPIGENDDLDSLLELENDLKSNKKVSKIQTSNATEMSNKSAKITNNFSPNSSLQETMNKYLVKEDEITTHSNSSNTKSNQPDHFPSTSKITLISPKSTKTLSDSIKLSPISSRKDIETHKTLDSSSIKTSCSNTSEMRHSNNASKCLTLNKLNNMTVSRGKFRVKAKFKAVVEKLSLNKQHWHIKIRIVDDSDELDVLMDSGITEEMFGHSPNEIQALRTRNRNDFSNTFQEALNGFKDKLINLNAIIEISYKDKIPTITNIF